MLTNVLRRNEILESLVEVLARWNLQKTRIENEMCSGQQVRSEGGRPPQTASKGSDWTSLRCAARPEVWEAEASCKHAVIKRV